MRFFYRCAFILLGVILGPAGCPVGAEYGPPPIRMYLLDGQVVASASGFPIAGIAVDFRGHRVLTRGDGTWQIEADVFPSNEPDLLELKDIDGDENGGLFMDETVPLDPIFTGRDTWEQHDITVDLDRAGPS